MRKILQMIFCILACLCVVAAIPLGAFWSWVGFAIAAGGALLFALLMIIMKNGLPTRIKKQPRVDFMNTPEENEAILAQQRETEEKTEKQEG